MKRLPSNKSATSLLTKKVQPRQHRPFHQSHPKSQNHPSPSRPNSATVLSPSSSSAPPAPPSLSTYANPIPLPRNNGTNHIREWGQPIPATHPHLFDGPNELTPGITALEYELRRAKLVDRLEDGAVVVLAGGKTKYMAKGIFYRFRQSSDFWYLTGYQEPDSALILEKNSSRRGYKMTLFVRPSDEDDQLWNGPRSGIDGAVQVFGADEAYDVTHFTSYLHSIVSHSPGPIYIDMPDSPTPTGDRYSSSSGGSPSWTKSLFTYLSPSEPDANTTLEMLSPSSSSSSSSSSIFTPSTSTTSTTGLSSLLRILSGSTSTPVHPLRPHLDRLRLVKSPSELSIMSRAAQISARAHARSMRHCSLSNPLPGSSHARSEHDLVVHFEHSTALQGSLRPAYVPVCASGRNALTLHYTANCSPLREGELVLLDAGAEYRGYASDLTRTFPVSGRFTKPQRELYEAVLDAHRECLRRCSVKDAGTLNELHRVSVERLERNLRELGFDFGSGGRRKRLEDVVYPHFVGHPVGIDLHDTPTYQRSSRLQQDMVITIEPGVYVPPDDAYPKAYHNIGIRIEDEVHVREDDCVVLTVDAPKEIADVEATASGLLDGVDGRESNF